METVSLSEAMMREAYEADKSLQKLITVSVLYMFAGGTFARSENGGWRGIGGFYGESTALGIVLEFASRQPDPKTA